MTSPALIRSARLPTSAPRPTLAKLVGLLDEDSYAEGKTLLQRIASMLVRMVER